MQLVVAASGNNTILFSSDDNFVLIMVVLELMLTCELFVVQFFLKDRGGVIE